MVIARLSVPTRNAQGWRGDTCHGRNLAAPVHTNRKPNETLLQCRRTGALDYISQACYAPSITNGWQKLIGKVAARSRSTKLLNTAVG